MLMLLTEISNQWKHTHACAHTYTHTNLGSTLWLYHAISLKHLTKPSAAFLSRVHIILVQERVNNLWVCASIQYRELQWQSRRQERRRPLFLETVFSWHPRAQGHCGLPLLTWQEVSNKRSVSQREKYGFIFRRLLAEKLQKKKFQKLVFVKM